MPYLQNTFIFLIDTIFDFFIFILLLRFWMQWVQASFRNPLGQFILTISSPLVLPFRKLLPHYRYMDTASIILVYIFCLLKIYVLYRLTGITPPWEFTLKQALGDLLQTSIYIFIGAIIIDTISSWVSTLSYHPIVTTAKQIAQPLLMPIRKIMPDLGGIDLSPLIAFLFLRVSLYLFVAPLHQL